VPNILKDTISTPKVENHFPGSKAKTLENYSADIPPSEISKVKTLENYDAPYAFPKSSNLPMDFLFQKNPLKSNAVPK
jgi:hypothetical protein